MILQELRVLQEKLDTMYGSLRRDYVRGDLSLEDIARAQLETMKLLGELIVAVADHAR